MTTSALVLVMALGGSVLAQESAPKPQEKAKASTPVEGICSEPRPFALQTVMNETHVRYELNVYSDQSARQARIFTAIHRNIQDGFHQAGVRMLVPTYVDLLGPDSTRLQAATPGLGARDGVSSPG